MSYELGPFKEDYIDEAAHLLAQAYTQEQLAHPHLPELHVLRNGRGIDYFRTHLQASLTGQNAGVAAFAGGRLCGFLLESMRFEWKGQMTVLCDELSHAARGASDAERMRVYRLLYQELAMQWVREGRQLHIIRHLAHDAALKETLYLFGFGAILAENLRGVTPIGTTPALSAQELEILEDPDPATLLDLQKEHTRYYRQSPIFLAKDDSDDTILADLAAHLDNGDKFFACAEQGHMVSLFIVGESSLEGEGLLLRQSNTAQIKSAYSRPGARGKGVGSVLLDRSIVWARAQGYARVFVEHETANATGARFWGRYFTPFVYASMRYVDSTL